MLSHRDRNDIEVLDPETCLGLLASEPLGRVAFLEAGAPRILPVNHLVDGSSVVFRSAVGAKLDAADRHHPMAFEVDRYDGSQGTGWSVLVTGLAEIVDDEDEAERLDGLGLRSWAMGPQQQPRWVRIRAEEITGRWAGRDPDA